MGLSGGETPTTVQFPDESVSDVSTTRATSCPHLAQEPFRQTSPLRSSPLKLVIGTEARHSTQNTFAKIRSRAAFGMLLQSTAARVENFPSLMVARIPNRSLLAQRRIRWTNDSASANLPR